MRVIKFRGFHADEHGETVIKIDGKEIRGLWLVGDLKQYDGECWIEEHAVIPETVGQYVCDDGNGKEIFEGDIVEGLIFSGKWKGVIIWINEIAGFGIRYAHRQPNSPTAWEKSSLLKLLRYSNNEFSAKKIGNIYDNPDWWRAQNNECW